MNWMRAANCHLQTMKLNNRNDWMFKMLIIGHELVKPSFSRRNVLTNTCNTRRSFKNCEVAKITLVLIALFHPFSFLGWYFKAYIAQSTTDCMLDDKPCCGPHPCQHHYRHFLYKVFGTPLLFRLYPLVSLGGPVFSVMFYNAAGRCKYLPFPS